MSETAQAAATPEYVSPDSVYTVHGIYTLKGYPYSNILNPEGLLLMSTAHSGLNSEECLFFKGLSPYGDEFVFRVNPEVAGVLVGDITETLGKIEARCENKGQLSFNFD